MRRLGLVLMLCATPAFAQQPKNSPTAETPTMVDRVVADYTQRLAEAIRQAVMARAVAEDTESQLKWVLDNWVAKTAPPEAK